MRNPDISGGIRKGPEASIGQFESDRLRSIMLADDKAFCIAPPIQGLFGTSWATSNTFTLNNFYLAPVSWLRETVTVVWASLTITIGVAGNLNAALYRREGPLNGAVSMVPGTLVRFDSSINSQELSLVSGTTVQPGLIYLGYSFVGAVPTVRGVLYTQVCRAVIRTVPNTPNLPQKTNFANFTATVSQQSVPHIVYGSPLIGTI